MISDTLLTLIRHLRGWHPPPPDLPQDDLPQDPDSGVRQPRWRGPGGRESAMAVPEPAPEMHVNAVARVVARTDAAGRRYSAPNSTGQLSWRIP